MAINVKPLTDRFGAEAVGLDLAADMDDETFAGLRRAYVEAGVLLVRGQSRLTPDDHIRFSRRFGALEEHVLTQFLLPGHPEIFVVSNIVENGRHIGAHGGSKEFHSDLAYLETPSLGSVFRCLERPEEGGETAFVSMAAAYDDLPEGLRRRLDGLEAVYDYVWNYERKFLKLRGPLSEAQKAKTPPVIHPVVVAHPETGRRSIFLSEIWVRNFVGMGEEESQDLLNEVLAIATRPEAEYVHTWSPGDVVIWDNRSTLHRACPFDQANTRRLMHRTTIAGVGRPMAA